ncbi:LytR/AlgR family response regulator transcription factor [Ferruginibacter sp.]
MLTPVPSGFILLPTCKGVQVIDTQTIIRVEASNSYSKLFFNNGKHLVVAKVLSRMEAQLSSTQFIRIHRAHLVNKQFIQQYLHGVQLQVQLLNGESIPVAKRKRSSFLKYISAAA